MAQVIAERRGIAQVVAERRGIAQVVAERRGIAQVVAERREANSWGNMTLNALPMLVHATSRALQAWSCGHALATDIIVLRAAVLQELTPRSRSCDLATRCAKTFWSDGCAESRH
jgi:hypothetical protein